MSTTPHIPAALTAPHMVVVACCLLFTVTFAAEVAEFHFDPLRAEETTFQNRADVVQFIDETDMSIGRAIAYIAWRELFGSIQDLPSSGTKLLTFDDDPIIQNKIVHEYNYDVARIANEHCADFVLWGVVREVDDAVLLWSYVAVSDNKIGPGLEVRIQIEGDRRHNIVARLPQKQFNFTPLRVQLPEFGHRRWFVRRPGANIFASPNADLSRMGTLKLQSHFDSREIADKWVRLDDQDGGDQFVELWPLDLLPETAFHPENVQLWARPTRGSAKVPVDARNATAVVENQAYVGDSEIKWFEVNIGDQRGWLPAENVVTSQQLPAGYLLAAMLRFQGERFRRTIDEVSLFLKDGRETDNAILAFANELRAAAELMVGDTSPELSSLIQDWLDTAVELTPYDPAAYRLRAVAQVAQGDNWRGVIDDLLTASQLDRRDRETHTIVKSLIGLITDDTFRKAIRPGPEGLNVEDIHAQLIHVQSQLLPVIDAAGEKGCAIVGNNGCVCHESEDRR